ncbi:MAG: hypothetical protein JWN15_4052 [Firmicutes bacterium]|nr:hypothetical protein [Bacillota bacterium]
MFKHVIPVLFVEDVESAMEFYTEKLGFQVSFRSEWEYHGVVRDGIELNIGKGKPNTASTQAANLYFMVDSVDAVREEFVRSGAVASSVQVIEQSYGSRELHLRDPFGYHLAFSEPQKR